MITEIQQETLDIDWFFTNGDEIGFVASGGGKLPKAISNKSIEEIELLSAYFKSLSQNSSVSINPNLSRYITPAANKNQYLSCFVEMAEKGLFAFDKTIPNRFSDINYHLVAKPLYPLKLTELPTEIISLINLTKIEGDMQDHLSLLFFSE